MAKARPRDLAGGEGVQGGVRHERPEGLGGLQEGGHGGLQEGVQGRSGDGQGGEEPALDNHLTGTLGGEIESSTLHFSCCSWQPPLLQMHCSALNAAPHRHTSHEWKYLSDNVIDHPKHAALFGIKLLLSHCIGFL